LIFNHLNVVGKNIFRDNFFGVFRTLPVGASISISP